MIGSTTLQDAASSISTAEGLRVFLSSRDEVISLRRAFATEAIGPDDLREFVRRVLQRFAAGRRFGEESSIAAIAVALETHPAPFAEEFLSILSRVIAAEVPLASRVARLCLRQRRYRITDGTARTKTIANTITKLSGPSERHPSAVRSGVDYERYLIGV